MAREEQRGSGPILDGEEDADVEMDMDVDSSSEGGTACEEPDRNAAMTPRLDHAMLPAFEPYRSLLLPISASPPNSPNDSRKRRRTENISDTPEKANVPPWRSALGRGFLAVSFDMELPSPDLLAEHQDLYIEILESTFSGFSDIPIGADMYAEAMAASTSVAGIGSNELQWETDIDRQRGVVAGDTEILYSTLSQNAIELSIPGLKDTPRKSASNRACWNCGDTSHRLTDCPLPRNHANINSARMTFNRQKEINDATMPSHHRPYLDSYVCTTEDRQRRLDLATRFGLPGKPSSQLLDAVFWIEPEENDEGVYLDGEDPLDRERRADLRIRLKIKRNKMEMPWYTTMVTWGYPPGWIGAQSKSTTHL